jgi:hypothetical protein
VAEVPLFPAVRERRTRRGIPAFALLAGIAIVAAACSAGPAPTAAPTLTPGPSATPPPSVLPSDAPPTTGTAFGDAWAAAVGAHDRQATEVMIANPLAEWDLVGTRLIDVLGQTRAELSALAPPAELRPETLALDEGIGATLATLEAIDPHGPRPEQAAAFLRALDDWTDNVRPRAEAIRDALGLPPVPQGDLQL